MAGARATAHTRPFDVVVRYGGEEFAVILPHAGVGEAIVAGERLRRAVEAAPWTKRPITISVGASTTAGELDGTALFAHATRPCIA